MPTLTIALLGPPEITRAGQPVGFEYAKVRALLAYLAAEAQRTHARDALAELFWPEQPATAGRNSLRRALMALRQAIGDAEASPPLLLTTRETVQLNPQGDYTLDSARFAELIAACERHDHPSPARCPACLERWAAAARLYRGPFLDGLALRDCPEFEAWMHGRREWFEQGALAALARVADAAEAAGELEPALQQARRQLGIDPWRESAHRQAMRALAGLGQRSAALAQFEQCRSLLRAELDADPEPETIALAEQIRAGALRAAPAETPPQPTAPTTQLRQAPAPSAGLLGRDAELAELAGMLGEPDCRLVTLLGPGGIGKTRLARALADTLAERYADGAAWVSLAELDAPAELPGAIASALGGSLDQAPDPRAALRDMLRPRELLLVLDNFEHLVGGADLLADLLAAAPRLKLLATSRERLFLQSEWLFDLAGLPFPPAEADAGAAGATPAVQLLLARARQVRRGGPLAPDEAGAVAAIARLVEGMPLALELAAAASREQSFPQIAATLAGSFDLLSAAFRDLPARHRSMRAALEHSWRLLDAGLRRRLAWLSVFRGGCSAEAALAVAGASQAELAALADRSLLRVGRGRYSLHELVRQFASEQLAEENDAAHTALLAYLAEQAEIAETALLGEQQERWMALLEQERPNINAALRWGLDHGRLEDAARIAAALWRFWWMRGTMREGRRWLDELLAQPAGIGAATRARAAKGAGSLANQQGDYASALAYHQQSLAMQQELGNRQGMANALGSLARVWRNMGDYRQARELQEQGLAIHREQGNARGISLSLDGLAELAHSQGDYARAVELYGQSLPMHRARNDRHSIAIAIVNLGELALMREDDAAALASAQEGLALFRELGNVNGIAAALHILGDIARRQGDPAESRGHYAEALELLRREGHLAGITSALIGLAELALDAGDPARALRLCGAAEGLRTGSGGSFSPRELRDHERALAAARAALGPEAGERAWAAGLALTPEQAADEALAG